MQEQHKTVLMLARLVDLFGKADGAMREKHDCLVAIVDHLGRHSTTVRLDDDVLSVEGVRAPQDIPFVRTFLLQMTKHGVAELRFVRGAPAVDVLALAKALAGDPREESLQELLDAAGATTVNIAGLDALQAWHSRRGISPAAALSGGDAIPEARAGAATGATGAAAVRPAGGAGPAASPGGGEKKERDSLEFVPAQEGAAYGQMVELTQASKTSLAAAVHRLKGHADGPELAKGLNAVAVGVTTAIRDNRVNEAIDAVIGVIRQEADEPREDVALRYGVTLRRILQPEVLSPLLEILIDPMFASDVTEIMRRAGTRGTELMVERLVSAPTFAERRVFMDALRQIDTGLDIVVRMLSHHEWYVVRNIADLVGELKLEEGISGLGEAAKHADARVRKSAGIALARIGTASSVRHLAGLLRDPDPGVRLEIVQLVEGKGLAGLAMPLVNAAEAEEDEDFVAECYRALGRLGSNEAVQVVAKASKPGGLLLHRVSTKLRIAATEGLARASAEGNANATGALKELIKDRDKLVRELARRALEGKKG